jgi:mycofactocin precursor
MKCQIFARLYQKKVYAYQFRQEYTENDKKNIGMCFAYIDRCKKNQQREGECSMAPQAALLEIEELMNEPEVLDELMVEEMTIDCICGVY